VKLLAIMRPRQGVDISGELEPHAETELRELWTLYQGDAVREMYSPGGPGAVLVLESDSVEQARRTLSRLPLLANEIMSLELIELRPFTALQMLCSEGSRP